MSQPDYLKSHLAERAEEERKLKEEPLYRIKPLAWEYRTFHGLEIFEARSLEKHRSYYVRGDGGKWEYYAPGGCYIKCDSLEDGKAKCEEHYRAFIAAALEVVEL